MTEQVPCLDPKLSVPQGVVPQMIVGSMIFKSCDV